MITLVSSMSREGGKLQHCTSAKKMWQTLENHCEGNIQVKSNKVQIHMYEYELFKMKPHEDGQSSQCSSHNSQETWKIFFQGKRKQRDYKNHT